jgi:hypothetical protein
MNGNWPNTVSLGKATVQSWSMVQNMCDLGSRKPNLEKGTWAVSILFKHSLQSNEQRTL